MSIFASAVRTSLRQTSARTFTTKARFQNLSRDSAAAPSLTNTIRSVAERAQVEAADESFKAGVVYTLLGVSAIGAGYLIVAPNKGGKTVLQRDLL